MHIFRCETYSLPRRTKCIMRLCQMQLLHMLRIYILFMHKCTEFPIPWQLWGTLGCIWQIHFHGPMAKMSLGKSYFCLGFRLCSVYCSFIFLCKFCPKMWSFKVIFKPKDDTQITQKKMGLFGHELKNPYSQLWTSIIKVKPG